MPDNATAETAEVSRKTVFTAVDGEVELLKLALDWSVVGDDDKPAPLGNWPEMRKKENLAGSDPARFLREWERILVDIDGRGAALPVVPRGRRGSRAGRTPAVGTDAGAAARRRPCRRRPAVELGGLREGLTAEDAADLAWLNIDPTLYARLVLDRRWSSDRFAHTMSWQLLGVRGAAPAEESDRARSTILLRSSKNIW